VCIVLIIFVDLNISKPVFIAAVALLKGLNQGLTEKCREMVYNAISKSEFGPETFGFLCSLEEVRSIFSHVSLP
jgi:hypothetical protein